MAKHRSGAVGDVKLRFVNRFARFENWNDNADMVNAAFGSLETRREDSRMNTDTSETPTGGFAFGTGHPSGGPDLSPSPGEEVPPI